MREYFAVNKFRQGRHLWMPVVLLLALTPMWVAAEQPVSKPSVPANAPAKKQTFKPGTPEAAVALLLDVRFTGPSRDINEKISLLYPFVEHENDVYGSPDLFNSCKQNVLIRNYRIVGGDYAPQPVNSPSNTPRIYLVTVEAEVLLLRAWAKPEIPKRKGFCGWKSLEIVNRETGQTKKIGDVLMDDSGTMLFSYERFGRGRLTASYPGIPDDYMFFIDPGFRLWRFRVPLVYRDVVRTRAVTVDGRVVHKRIPHRGWIFVSPFLPAHTSVEEVLNVYIQAKEDDLQQLANCEGRGKPLDPGSRASLCSPKQVLEYRERIKRENSEVDFYRSLLNDSTQDGAP